MLENIGENTPEEKTMKNILISIEEENTKDADTVLSASIKSDDALSLDECLVSVCMIYKSIATQTDITREQFAEAVFKYLNSVQFDENDI